MIRPLNASESTAVCVASVFDLSCPPPDLPPAGCWALLLVLLGAVMVTVAGNSFIIASILYFRQLQTRSNVLVASLSVADVLVGLLIMPFSAVRTTFNCWPYGPSFCHLHTWLDFSTCTSSIVNLAFISFERYVCVSRPLVYKRRISPRLLVLMVVTSWVGLPVYGATFLLGLNLIGIEGRVWLSSCQHDCRVYMNPESTTLNVLLGYVTPMVTMAAANARIHQLARQQSRKIRSSTVTEAVAVRPRRLQSNATHTLAIVTGVFVVLWMPYILLAMAEPLLGYATGRATWEVVCWLPYLNSAANPVLVVTFNRSFNGAARLVASGRATRPGARGTDLLAVRDGTA